MAQRRMFSKSITNSSQFLMMPQSSQNLYFHLGMNADDDGFVEHFAIMRMTDSKPDDLKILQGKGFAHVFDDKVLVIIDWKENNYLRSDRYTPSKYLSIYKNELKGLASGIPNGNHLDPQDRLGKDRKGKDKEQEANVERLPGTAKTPYGEFANVKLTEEEHTKLVEKIGERDTQALIEELSGYIASKGKRYSSHYATILNWSRRKSQENTSNQKKIYVSK